jgi:adenosylcobinamide-GDP ribazoletransferase
MSVILLTAWTAMTGGVHLDGFADTCDGLYGGRSREEALKIMCDSRIGTMGAAGVALLLIFKFAVLSSMQPECLWKTLIMAPLFARWSQGLACSISKYAREEGKAKYFIEHAKRSDVSIGALFTLAVSWLLFGGGGIVLFAVLAATISLFMQYVKGRIGGMTGDTIGATNEVAEAAALFFSLILMSHKI